MATTLFQNQFSLENCENVNERITEYFSRRGYTNILSNSDSEGNMYYVAEKTVFAFVKRKLVFNISVNLQKKLMFAQISYKKLFSIKECDVAFIDTEYFSLTSFLQTKAFNETPGNMEGNIAKSSRNAAIFYAVLLSVIALFVGYKIFSAHFKMESGYERAERISDICIATFLPLSPDLANEVSIKLEEESGLSVNVLTPMQLDPNDLMSNFDPERKQYAGELFGYVLDIVASAAPFTDTKTVFVAIAQLNMYSKRSPDLKYSSFLMLDKKRYAIATETIFRKKPEGFFTGTKAAVKNRVLKLMRCVVVNSFKEFDIPENAAYKTLPNSVEEIDAIKQTKLVKPQKRAQ